MSWPTPQDYNEAIQSPATCFADADLRNGEVELTPIGIPRAVTGAFASVYKITTVDGDWAVRCFLTDRPGQKERYETISKHVLLDNLEYTVEFHYIEEGIQVRRSWYPILKMNWVYGQTLESFLIDNYDDPEEILMLRDRFFDLAKGIDDADMAHGDLQHGNIIVTPQGLRLVDYDAMFVPDLLGKTSLELGHPNYQHPLRTAHHYDRTVDNFSCWLIYLSLSIVALDSDLFKNFNGGDECILFRKRDLAEPESSKVFAAVLNHEQPEIKEYGNLIMRMLWSSPQLIPELHRPEELVLLPEVRPDSLSTEMQEVDQAEKNPISDISFAESTENRFQRDLDLDWSPTDRPAIPKDKKRRKKSIKGIFKAAAVRVASALDNAQKAIAPNFWCQNIVIEGDKFYREGDQEKAVELYLVAFKEIYKYKSNDYDLDLLIQISLKLADTLTSLGNFGLATNYFYVAYKQSCRKSRPNRSEVALAAFLLALNRFNKGDTQEAIQLFLDDPRLSDQLSYLIDLPKFQEPEVLAMLFVVCEALYSHADKELTKRCFDAAEHLHEKMIDRVSLEDKVKVSVMQIHMASISLEHGNIEEAIRYYNKFVQINTSGKTKSLISVSLTGGNIDSENEELLRSIDPYKKTIRVCAAAQSLVLADSVEQFKSVINSMEEIEAGDIYNCIQYRYSVKASQTLLTPLLMLQAERDAPARYAVFQKALANFGSIEDIKAYLEFLTESKQKGALESFQKIFLPACESKKIVQVGRRISNKTYTYCQALFEAPVVEAGATEDILRHLEFLDRDFETMYSRAIVISLIEVRSLHFSLNLLLRLCEQGFQNQVKSIYTDRESIFARLYGSRASINDICLFAELLLEIGEDEASKELVSEVIRVNDDKVLATMVGFMKNRPSDRSIKVLWFIYLGTISSSKTFILAMLDCSTIERLFHHIHRQGKEPLITIFIQEFYALVRAFPEYEAKSGGRFNQTFANAVLNVFLNENSDIDFDQWQKLVTLEMKRNS